MTGAEVTEEGVTFSYTKEKQEGAVYDVYAEKEIVRADGTVAYKKGAEFLKISENELFEIVNSKKQQKNKAF